MHIFKSLKPVLAALTLELVAVCLLGSALIAQQPPAQAPPVDPQVEEFRARADAMVKQMTLEEKIDYIGGIHGFYVREVPKLKMPALRMSDGPLGERNDGPSTTY